MFLVGYLVVPMFLFGLADENAVDDDHDDEEEGDVVKVRVPEHGLISCEVVGVDMCILNSRLGHQA